MGEEEKRRRGDWENWRNGEMEKWRNGESKETSLPQFIDLLNTETLIPTLRN